MLVIHTKLWERGIAMPKRKKNRLKIVKNSHNGLLIDLEKIAKKPGSDREKAQSLVSWYLKVGFWTDKQKLFAQSLIHKSTTKKPEKPRKYHLYAIGDGESVKLGVSTNVGKRLDSMQTGHPKRLNVLWKLFVGREKSPAYTAEKKLHKLCKSYRLRGEWFKAGCMAVVEKFTLKERKAAAYEQHSHDIKLLTDGRHQSAIN